MARSANWQAEPLSTRIRKFGHLSLYPKFTKYESKELTILYFKFCSEYRNMKSVLKQQQFYIVTAPMDP